MASAMLSRSATVHTVAAALPSHKLRAASNSVTLGGMFKLSPKLRNSRAMVPVSAKQDIDNTPLPSTKVEPETKPDPLRVFEDSPVAKFYRPENERRPEDGNISTSSLMKFDGPAPETINSRLAMVGITWALVAEILTGQSVVEQVTEGRGLIWFLFVVPVFIAASLIPMYNRESPDSRRNGPFNAKAERWNGRAAMVGLIALLITENIYLKGPLLGFVHNSLNF